MDEINRKKLVELNIFLQEVTNVDSWGSHVIDVAIDMIKSLSMEKEALEHEREEWELAMNNLKDSYLELESVVVVDMNYQNMK